MNNSAKIGIGIVLSVMAIWLIIKIVKVLLLPAIVIGIGYVIWKKYLKKDNNTVNKE